MNCCIVYKSKHPGVIQGWARAEDNPVVHLDIRKQSRLYLKEQVAEKHLKKYQWKFTFTYRTFRTIIIILGLEFYGIIKPKSNSKCLVFKGNKCRRKEIKTLRCLVFGGPCAWGIWGSQNVAPRCHRLSSRRRIHVSFFKLTFQGDQWWVSYHVLLSRIFFLHHHTASLIESFHCFSDYPYDRVLNVSTTDIWGQITFL